MSLQRNVEPAFLQMWPCEDSIGNTKSTTDSKQSIFYNHTTGQLVYGPTVSGEMKCLAPFSFDNAFNAAAGLTLTDCVDNEKDRNLHVKQRFHFSATQDPRKVPKGKVLTGVQTTMCLALKSSAPLNSNTLQMWAKRLPVKGSAYSANDVNVYSKMSKKTVKRAAVFLINADRRQSHIMNINNKILAKIFQIDLVPKGLIRITDIWQHSIPFLESPYNETEVDPKYVLDTMHEDDIRGYVGDIIEDHAREHVGSKVVDDEMSWSVTIPPRDSRFFIFELIYKHKTNTNKIDSDI